MGLIMDFNFLIGISKNPPRADKSALGAINRPLQLVCLQLFLASAGRRALTNGKVISTIDCVVNCRDNNLGGKTW
jgi:hypothetical protein